MKCELPSSCVLAVDIGTTALKAAVINASGEVLDYSRIEFSNKNFSEQWYLALKEACAKMRDAVQNAKAICVSGNGPTIVFADGTTLLWNESVDEEEFSNYKQDFQQPELLEAASHSIFLPRILAAKNLYPSLFQSEQKIFSGPEFLINKLCGAEITILPEPHFENAYWNDEILDALKIPREKLCPFIISGSIAGELKPQIAEELLLPQGIPIIGAGPDFIAALVGTNTLFAGALCDRAGSSEGINLCTPSPIVAEGIRTLPSVIAGLWNASYLIPNPGNTIEEKAANFAKGIETLKKLASAKSHTSKTTDSTNSEDFPSPFNCFAVALQGNISTTPLTRLAGHLLPSTVITGGQALNENIVQAKADASGIKIGVQQIADAELLGDAAFAFTALGEFDSIQKAANAICKTTKIFYPKNYSEAEK